MLPDTYQKLVAKRFSKDFRAVAEVARVPLAPPGPSEITVRVAYAGVNATDVNISSGSYTPGKPPPIDLGAEVVGEVAAVGSEVSDFRVGDPVAVNALGGYAEFVTVRARLALPVPEATPEVLALVVSGLTASLGLAVGELKAGETLLVTAAAGGTGQFAVQLAKGMGAHVIGTCGGEAKAALLRSLGCDRVVNYQQEDLDAVLTAEYPRGVDVVYESVGRAMFDTALAHLAIKGRMVIIGYVSEYVSGAEAASGPRVYVPLLAKSASLRGMFLPHYWKQTPEHMTQLMTLYRGGKLHVAVDPTPFAGLAQVADAVDYLHSGRSSGKVVVRLG